MEVDGCPFYILGAGETDYAMINRRASLATRAKDPELRSVTLQFSQAKSTAQETGLRQILTAPTAAPCLAPTALFIPATP